ncbi:MAG TPA: carboxypeptidase-like regulatory domain-containing protein [Planctomycetota bacterium]|nr:carboxypeptidase-like regulatory domain-containing protein [Planctomycetota bacterium]
MTLRGSFVRGDEVRMHTTVTAGALVLVAFAVASPTQAAGAAKGDVRLVGRIVSVLHEGVPAAEVWVTDAQGQRLARTVADGDGYYQLARLPFVPLQVHASGGDKVEGAIAVASNGLVREATLMLEDGDPLRGTVVLPDGSAAAGAAVMVTAEERLGPPFEWYAETTADAKGQWTLPMAPLRPLVVSAFAAGRPLGEAKVARGRAGDVRVAIPAGELTTRPVRVTGMPAGTAVRVVCELGLERRRTGYRVPTPAIEAIVDAAGTAALWDLQIGYGVRVVAPGWKSMPISIPCKPGTARDLEFVLTAVAPEDVAPSTRMTGRLVDEVGWPLADVTIQSRYESSPDRVAKATSEGDGTFAIDVPVSEQVLCQFGLVSREWRLGAQDAKLGAEGVSWLTIKAGSKPLRLYATRGGTLKGTVLGPSRTPLAAAKVELTAVQTTQPVRVVTATDAAGRLDVAALPAGTYAFQATGFGMPAGHGQVVITAGEEVAPPALTFAAAGEVRGTATGAGAALPTVAFVPAREEGRYVMHLLRGDGSAPVLTDRNGRFRVPGLAEGSWMMLPRVADGQAAVKNQASFAIEAGRVTTFDVTIDW